MSDVVEEKLDVPSVSKSSKKNKKRKKASQSTSVKKDELDFNEMLRQLKQKLEDAKAGNDHVKANELRNQVWVLTDMSRGVRTDISEEDLNRILEGIRKEISLPSLPGALASESSSSSSQKKDDSDAAAATTVVSGLQTNRLKNLQKKLDQIEALKERQKNGEKLEANQVEKIKSEEAVQDELTKLTEILSTIEIKH